MEEQKDNKGNYWDTIVLMRIPFSLFLMPVFWFAVAMSHNPDPLKAIIAFIVLHLFIYPASNGYNSYIDKDEGSIGGLKHPPKVSKSLFYTSLSFDIIGLGIALWADTRFFAGVLVYMLASRAYSAPSIRLKKYPMPGFLTVFIFQGGFTFWLVYNVISLNNFQFINPDFLLPAVASLLIGGIYPMTQIYQHEADAKDGVKTISMLLGKKGTFIFSGTMFLLASVLWLRYNWDLNTLPKFYYFLGVMFPVILFFTNWFIKVLKDPAKADFDHTMKLNLLSSVLLNVYFILLALFNHEII